MTGSPEPLATFCGNGDCGCPQMFVDESAPAERRVVITDDFGQRVQMSADQFGSLIEEAKAGRLDAAVSCTSCRDPSTYGRPRECVHRAPVPDGFGRPARQWSRGVSAQLPGSPERRL